MRTLQSCTADIGYLDCDGENKNDRLKREEKRNDVGLLSLSLS